MAQVINLFVDKGTDWSKQLIAKDNSLNIIDLTNYTLSFKLMEYYGVSQIYTLSATVSNTPTQGIYTLSASHTDLSNIKSGRYFYNVFGTDNLGKIIKILEGIININPDTSGTP